jgi:hypothetical protein
MSINISPDTSNVVIQGTTNTVTVVDATNSVNVSTSQPITNVITVAIPGPQGAAGEIPSTGSFATTASLNSFTSSYNTGSFTGSFIGSLSGTSSYATNALTASYVLNGGSETGFPYTGSAEISGSLKVIGKLLHGQYTATTGDYSHAEGISAWAQALYSHAEGFMTTTIGEASHAEGVSTNASGSYSHAEGSGTVARGLGSHAEGLLTIAEGEGSHAEGNLATALGDYSHAEGDFTQAKGNYSHAEGQETLSSGSYSHAEGYATIASGSWSHAEGSGTVARGIASHVEGFQTVALGDYQHVQGQYNISSSAQSAFIIGNGVDNSNRSNLVFASGSQFEVTGSVIATQGFTGSLFGTASYATQALSASWAPGGTTIDTGSFATTGSVTFTGQQIVTGSTRGNVTALSITSNTASINLSTGNFFTLQLVSGSNTFINPSNILPGQTSLLTLSTTGSATVSFPSFVKQPSGSAYIPTTSTGVDILTFVSVDSSTLYVANIKNMI